jgi:PAS domain-containing protein
MELALDASGVGMWDWDLPNDVLSWDERTCTIFGVPPRVPRTIFLEKPFTMDGLVMAVEQVLTGVTLQGER